MNKCEKLGSIFQKVIVRNIAIISHNEYDSVRIEYITMIKEYKIRISNDDILYEV